MKIAVIGTSNSIRGQGYFPLYQALEYPNIVENFSIGGSICQLIPFQIEKYDIFNNYDFLITDCSVNDNDYLIQKVRTPDWLYNELYTIMSTIKEAPIKHLHLIFPYDAPDNTYRKIHIQVCEELEIPYFDILDIIQSTPLHPDHKLFFDAQHINNYYAKLISYLIYKVKNLIFNDNSPKNLTKIYKNKIYININLINENNQKFPIKIKGSTLKTEKFVSLKKDDMIIINNLPSLNLESLFFYTNVEANYYHLISESAICNYNLQYCEGNYFYFRPIATNHFPIKKFLKLQVGLSKQCQTIIYEFGIKPHTNIEPELLINSFQVSKELNPPLTWQEKNIPTKYSHQIDIYKRIFYFFNNIDKITNSSPQLPNDFVFLTAILYPHNTTIRKQFLHIIKTTSNPYYLYYYAELYLIPRKKYLIAIHLLEKAINLYPVTSIITILINLYIDKKQFSKALKLINIHLFNNKVVYYRELCFLYAKIKNKEKFEIAAMQLLNLSHHSNILFFLAEHFIELNEKIKAKYILSILLKDPRNFQTQINVDKTNVLLNKIKKMC